MEKEQIRLFFILALILSGIGGVLLLATDFGGYWYYIWAEATYWVYICMTCGVLTGILIFLAGSMLLFCTFVSIHVLVGLGGNQMSNIDQEKLINLGVIFSYIVGTLCIAGAITLGIVGATIDAETSGSWLSPGFYGGLIGSAATAFFFKFYQSKLNQ
ncbi:MAG: hypothetical protein ACTSRC_12190 [Candidatus Helarchaeota archaeon]